jgi:hypothetical protein
MAKRDLTPGDKPPAPAKAETSQGAVDAFIAQLRQAPARAAGQRGRLIFALDATASREPTWDMASHIQAEMFAETAALGGLDVQLVYYRGFGQCRASGWVGDSADLVRLMQKVRCEAGRTQIERVLDHALKEAERTRVHALVFVGDAMEENPDALGDLAGRLGLQGVPCFMFHEGGDPAARRAFESVARLSGGACVPFDLGSARQLRALLAAVAVFAAGGRRALEDYGRRGGAEAVALLTHQLGKRP